MYLHLWIYLSPHLEDKKFVFLEMLSQIYRLTESILFEKQSKENSVIHCKYLEYLHLIPLKSSIFSQDEGNFSRRFSKKRSMLNSQDSVRKHDWVLGKNSESFGKNIFLMVMMKKDCKDIFSSYALDTVIKSHTSRLKSKTQKL